MDWPSANAMPCRYEQNTRALEIPLPGNGGEMYRYSYVVYLNRDCRQFSYGEPVRIYDSDILVDELPVKGFRRTQLHAMLYL